MPATYYEANDHWSNLRAVHLDTIATNIFSCTSRRLCECLKCHPRCKWRKGYAKLPRRLLSLSGLKESSSQGIQLINTHGRISEYCALSYCWRTEAENFGLITCKQCSKLLRRGEPIPKPRPRWPRGARQITALGSHIRIYGCRIKRNRQIIFA
jgi:hypothetical protein